MTEVIWFVMHVD